MKTKAGNASAAKPGPVEVTIAVSKFQEVLAADGGQTAFTLKLRQLHPQAVVKGDSIYVRRPGAVLRFTIDANGGDAERYFPVGIAFVRDGNDHQSVEHRLGHPSFPRTMVRLDGGALLVDDCFPAETRTVKHKFSIVIQRGSDGRLGIIDPDIIHENN